MFWPVGGAGLGTLEANVGHCQCGALHGAAAWEAHIYATAAAPNGRYKAPIKTMNCTVVAVCMSPSLHLLLLPFCGVQTG